MKPPKKTMVGSTLNAIWNPKPGHPDSESGKKYRESARWPNTNLEP